MRKNGVQWPAGAPDECWVWTHATDTFGYGRVQYGGRVQSAHLVAWIKAYGEINEDRCVLHRCDNPPCVNPAHLFLGTLGDNTRDMVSKGRHGSATQPERRARGDRNGAHVHPEQLARGERQWKARLTEERVREMRRLYAAGGITYEQLARRFNVSPASAHKAVVGQTWAHVK